MTRIPPDSSSILNPLQSVGYSQVRERIEKRRERLLHTTDSRTGSADSDLRVF